MISKAIINFCINLMSKFNLILMYGILLNYSIVDGLYAEINK